MAVFSRGLLKVEYFSVQDSSSQPQVFFKSSMAMFSQDSERLKTLQGQLVDEHLFGMTLGAKDALKPTHPWAPFLHLLTSKDPAQ